MENLREKLLVIISFIIIMAGLIVAFYILFINEEYYYTKIDNTKIQEIKASDEMKYEYNLVSYNENGKEKEIKFKTSRELKDGAYLKLTVMNIRGVITWEEVTLEEIPNKARANYE